MYRLNRKVYKVFSFDQVIWAWKWHPILSCLPCCLESLWCVSATKFPVRIHCPFWICWVLNWTKIPLRILQHAVPRVVMMWKVRSSAVALENTAAQIQVQISNSWYQIVGGHADVFEVSVHLYHSSKEGKTDQTLARDKEIINEKFRREPPRDQSR